MNLHDYIKRLENVTGDEKNKVFTMYLNTDPSDPDQQGGEWKIHLKNGLRNFESYLKEDDDKTELNHFKHVKEKVEKYMHDNEQSLQKGVFIFATGDDELWIAERVQMPVKTDFFWETTPALDQLKELHQTYPKTGVVLVQNDQVKVLKANANEVEDTKMYELNIDTDQWHLHEGPHRADASMGSGGKNLQQDQFKERFEANKQRWFKSIAPKLDKQAKDDGWEEIVIMGESDEADELASQMQKNPDKLIYKNMLDHKEDAILEEIYN
ncbi:uncharacterized protein JNUCC1_03016 [Lentibacillus sp. JNUCC-1]|uniref:VLRF1 family aeRF1-type release factor n=1 Tax=Lentibacillus sp. JNUCC-1 TaxID=2654513 RepID=UPI0012E8A75F|nr:VLRF1 family aeRF1-type release factor [Lentibacillus sp. JNUCC-1]MUV39143.1 uncharacterized protein [Lentibacillus sp. JNUCC-1]